MPSPQFTHLIRRVFVPSKKKLILELSTSRRLIVDLYGLVKPGELSNMDGQTVSSPRRFVYCFAQCGVRVNRRFDLLKGSLEVDGQAKFGDQFGRFRADDMSAEDFAVWFANDQFDETFRFADSQGFSVGRKGKLADFIF